MTASVEYTENPADKNNLNLTCWSKLDIKLVYNSNQLRPPSHVT